MEKQPVNNFVSPEQASGKDKVAPKEADGYNLSGADYDAFVSSFKAGRAEKDARWTAEMPVENRRPALHRRIGSSVMKTFERSQKTSASDELLPTSESTSGDTSTGNPDTPHFGDRYYQTSKLADIIDRRAASLSERLENRAISKADRKKAAREKAAERDAEAAAKRRERKEKSDAAKMERAKRRQLKIRRAAGRAAFEAARSTYTTTRRELSDDAKMY